MINKKIDKIIKVLDKLIISLTLAAFMMISAGNILVFIIAWSLGNYDNKLTAFLIAGNFVVFAVFSYMYFKSFEKGD